MSLNFINNDFPCIYDWKILSEKCFQCQIPSFLCNLRLFLSLIKHTNFTKLSSSCPSPLKISGQDFTEGSLCFLLEQRLGSFLMQNSCRKTQNKVIPDHINILLASKTNVSFYFYVHLLEIYITQKLITDNTLW